MVKKNKKSKVFWKIAITAFVFWIFDFLMHISGVGESHFYYISKFANSVIFASLWWLAFDSDARWKKIVYAFVFGTWISFYYLVSAYSGLVQWLGLYARYSAPPFVFGGLYLSPFLWWAFHAFAFYIGIEVAGLIKNK